VLRLLGEHAKSLSELQQAIPDDRLHEVLRQLLIEQLIEEDQAIYQLAH
jgi:hypothetical protein